jgi:TRAP-type C4-dicarboxylate transport system permease small subunit
MDLQKILKIVAIVIGVISIFFLGSILSAGDEAIKAGQSSGTVNVFMYVSYSILAVAVLIVLAFTVLNLVSNTSGLKNTLINLLFWVCKWS